jgi:hypothetical protein
MAANLRHPLRRHGKLKHPLTRGPDMFRDRDMRLTRVTRHRHRPRPAMAKSMPIGSIAKDYGTRNMNSAAGSLTRPMAQSVSSCNTGSVKSTLSGASADGERGVGSAQSDRPQREVPREPL